MKKNIAVVGCGYWGKNLVRNFSELEVLSISTTCCGEFIDQNSLILKTLVELYSLPRFFY